MTVITCPAQGDRADLDSLWPALIDADASQDARRLAALAWDLYGRLGQAQAARNRARAALAVLATARVAAAPRAGASRPAPTTRPAGPGRELRRSGGAARDAVDA